MAKTVSSATKKTSTTARPAGSRKVHYAGRAKVDGCQTCPFYMDLDLELPLPSPPAAASEIKVSVTVDKKGIVTVRPA